MNLEDFGAPRCAEVALNLVDFWSKKSFLTNLSIQVLNINESNLSTEDFELFWLADFKPQLACFTRQTITI